VTRLSPASLSVRVIVLVLLALVPGLGLTFYTAAVQRHQEAGRVKAQALLLARFASINEDQLVTQTRELLADLVQNPAIRKEDSKACHALLAGLLKRYPEYSNFGMSAPNGDVVCNARPMARPVNNADRGYFKRALTSKGFAIGEYQLGRVSGKAAINFGYPVLGAGGEVKAVVFAARDLVWINHLASVGALPSGAALTLVDLHGTVLARYPDPDRWVGRPSAQAGIMMGMLADGQGVVERPGVDGIPRLFGFTRLGGTGQAGAVFLIVDIPTAVAFAEVNRTFVRTLAALVLVGLLTLALTWVGGSIYILRPTNAVVTAAKRLAAGDLSARTGMPAVRGELGQLMRTFDEMAGALEQEASQLQRQLKRLGALRTIDTAITASPDLPMTLHILLEQVTLQLGVDAADVLLLSPHAPRLDYAAGRGFSTPALKHTHLPLGEGYAGRAAQDRRLICIPDLAKGAGDLVRAPLLSEEAFVAYCAVPLIAKGQVQGVLEIFHRAPLIPTKDWLNFLETLAGQAAIAIDNATLFANLQRSNADLELAYDRTLEGWSRALDLRDRETEGHSRRVTETTLHLARAMGLPEPDLVHIRRGALLHDIGKMGIPDAILLKPGPLTSEERAIIQRHPVYAYDLLSPIDFLQPALDIPYCHHEKWDGTGYPRRLPGQEIPLAARIFAVADVWDALRSSRPYRPAWTERRARQYIRTQAGKHFDPHVVQIFLRMQRETADATLAAGSE
jgi:putative nucleotidyltransferase with HDIG domain